MRTAQKVKPAREKEKEKEPMKTVGMRVRPDIIERISKIAARYPRLRESDVLRIIFEHGLEEVERLRYLPLGGEEGGGRRPLG